MRDNMRTIVFATVLAVVCSVVLTATSLLTRPYREANEEAEEVLNFLSVLEVPVEDKWDSKTLLEVFNKNVRISEVGDLTIYENISDLSESGTPSVVAVPFSGPGLWAPIMGILSLDPDLLTIRGIRFYQQEETPGLGGEIGSDWFQDQFRGKEIVSETGEPGFNILKPGNKKDKNSVDGISGATMTSDRVQTILDNLARKLWEERSSYVQ